MITAPDKVLCFVAHPDDLEPQAGGTLIRLIDSGADAHIVHAVVPEIDRNGKVIKGAYEKRKKEAMKAAETLGATVEFMDFDPNELIHSQDNVQLFDEVASRVDPDLIITHHEVDTQQDHIAVANLAQTVCRRNRIALWQLTHSFPGGYLHNRPQPNLFVDITPVQEAKMVAVRQYKSQMKRYSGLFEQNWMEIIEARDRYYGGMLNQDGLASTRYAEGFVVGKMVWKVDSYSLSD